MQNLKKMFGETFVLLIGGALILLILLSTNWKVGEVSLCEHLCKDGQGCGVEKTFEGQEHSYTEIKCNDNSKYSIIKD